MGSRITVPDAWEDDWETQADKQDAQPSQEPLPPAPMTKAERRAQHAETNRKLWESAETRETFHFVEATSNVPLASTFKPQVKVLSRKPPPTIARRDPVTGAMSQLSVHDDDDDDEKAKPVQLTPEEIRARQQREREEKQKRYDEARAKIFGESNPSSGATSPAGAGTVTPPRTDSRGNQRGGRGRGRGRGGGGGPSRQQQQQQHQHQHQQHQHQQDDGGRRPVSRPETPRSGAETRELYDPNFAPRPGFALQRRGDGGGAPLSGRSSPKDPQDQPRPAVRAPRGPDGSGRGGFGFARRGGKEA